MGSTSELQDWLGGKLACPQCGEAIKAGRGDLGCGQCGAAYRAKGAILDMMDGAVVGERASWQERLDLCDHWYADLRRDPPAAAGLLLHEYAPYKDFLATVKGDVLDIGGGAGVPRAWLAESAHYVSLEPSLAWLAGEWRAVAAYLPALKEPPTFVRGMGESLPFQPASFDTVLMFWSLNHVADPGRVVVEAARVLRPGGRMLTVLEDMRPRWRDILTAGFWAGGKKRGVRTALKMALFSLVLRPWPLQADHLRITDRDMERWAKDRFAIARRAWAGQFLSYELVRLAS